jgi:uncharacterized protein
VFAKTVWPAVTISRSSSKDRELTVAWVEAFRPFEAMAEQLRAAVEVPSADGAHDTNHIVRVWRNVRTIQQIEGGDLEILAAAVMLHDCIAVPKNSPERSRASQLAAVEAGRILRSSGWSEERTKSVVAAIETHSYSAGLTPQTLEARILQDADRLDAIGYLGVARCFYTAGRMGSEMYASSDPSGSGRELNDSRYALDHFGKKLLR